MSRFREGEVVYFIGAVIGRDPDGKKTKNPQVRTGVVQADHGYGSVVVLTEDQKTTAWPKQDHCYRSEVDAWEEVYRSTEGQLVRANEKLRKIQTEFTRVNQLFDAAMARATGGEDE